VARPGPFAALAHRNFALYLGARLLATLAVQMQSVAIGWQVYAITGKALDLGLIGLAQFLPFVVLVLPAGHVADRFDRRAIVAACYAVEAVTAILLLAFTWIGLTVVTPVFAALALFGAARAFAMPASQALTPNLVPRETFGNAVALNSSTFYVATVIGPTLGGLLYLVGPAPVYESVTVLLIVAVMLMALVRAMPAAQRDDRGGLATLLEGIRFVGSKPVVLGAISLDLFAVLFGGATALLPAIANDVLHVGPDGLGALRTAPAVGAGLIAAALAMFPISRHVGRFMFSGVAAFGAATVVFGLTSHFGVALVALGCLGAGDMLSVYVRQILIQLETPDAIRGRVSAVNAVFIGASNELGEFRAGVVAAAWGLVPAVVGGGVATLVVTALWTRLFPALRTMNRFPDRL